MLTIENSARSANMTTITMLCILRFVELPWTRWIPPADPAGSALQMTLV
jgi:hypothetical protein